MKLKGVVFKRKGDKGPLYSGELTVDGTKVRICLWENVSKGGTPYLSVSLDKHPPRQTAAPANQDEIPF